MADGGQEATTTSSVVNLVPTPFVLGGSVERFEAEDECWGGVGWGGDGGILCTTFELLPQGGEMMEGSDGIGREGGWTGGFFCL